MEKREREREYLHKEKPPPLYIDHCHFRKKRHQPDAGGLTYYVGNVHFHVGMPSLTLECPPRRWNALLDAGMPYLTLECPT